jgi:L-ascorbate metabolism protein UlaG (beta-lactamase superfamily)
LDITWYGHSCFRISERGRVTIVTDPFADVIGMEAPRAKGDVVTVSHDAPGHNFVDAIKGARHILRTPGEYEIGGVFILGLAMHNVQTVPPRANVAYMFDYDNLKVLHLGDLAEVPEQSVIEELGEVNVLLIPVGGGEGLKAAQAAEVVGLIEPHFVVPMHYAQPNLRLELDPVDKFLKAMGVSKAQEMDLLKVNVSDLPEQTQVIILNPQS